MAEGGHEVSEGGADEPSPSVSKSSAPTDADRDESGAVTDAEHGDPRHGQAGTAAGDPGDGREEPSGRVVAPRRSGRRRRWVIALGTLAVLCLLYILDLSVSSGTAPRGTTVAGVDVAGLSARQAEERLRAQLAPRLSAPTWPVSTKQ